MRVRLHFIGLCMYLYKFNIGMLLPPYYLGYSADVMCKPVKRARIVIVELPSLELDYPRGNHSYASQLPKNSVLHSRGGDKWCRAATASAGINSRCGGIFGAVSS